MSDFKCELCGYPMPEGEEMFKFHGYSCPCPNLPIQKETADTIPAHTNCACIQCFIKELEEEGHGAMIQAGRDELKSFLKNSPDHTAAKPTRETQTFKRGDLVRKKGDRGQWHGVVCGEYSATCTPEGYNVESLLERGSVQIYPASALEPWDGVTPQTAAMREALEALEEINQREKDRVETIRKKNPNEIVEASVLIISKEAISALKQALGDV